MGILKTVQQKLKYFFLYSKAEGHKVFLQVRLPSVDELHQLNVVCAFCFLAELFYLLQASCALSEESKSLN